MLRLVSTLLLSTCALNALAERRPVTSTGPEAPPSQATRLAPLLPPLARTPEETALLAEASAVLQEAGTNLELRGLRLSADAHERGTRVQLVDATGECTADVLVLQTAEPGTVARIALATQDVLSKWTCVPRKERRLRLLEEDLEIAVKGNATAAFGVGNLGLAGLGLGMALADGSAPALGMMGLGLAGVTAQIVLPDTWSEPVHRAAFFGGTALGLLAFSRINPDPLQPTSAATKTAVLSLLVTGVWQAWLTADSERVPLGRWLQHRRRFEERATRPLSDEELEEMERDVRAAKAEPSCWVAAAPLLVGSALTAAVATRKDTIDPWSGVFLGAGLAAEAMIACVLKPKLRTRFPE